MSLLLNGHYREAERYLSKSNPKEYLSWLGKAALLFQNYDRAMGYYQRAIKKQPSNDTLFEELGFIQYHLGYLKEAKQTFRQSLVLNPRNAKAYFGLGKTCFKRLEYDEAIDAYKNATSNKSKYPDAYVGLGEVYEFMGLYKQADKAYQKAIKLDPNHVDAYLGLSTLRLHQHQWNESVKYFETYERLTSKPSP